MIAWVDLETTGLEPREGSILEIALVMTDDELNEIGEPFVSLVWPLHGRGLYEADPFVVKMHEASGLADELYIDGPGGPQLVLRDDLPRLGVNVEPSVLEWLYAHLRPSLNESKKIPLAGNSVHFDRAWLKEHLPDFERLFSHRNVDVSTLNELAKRWNRDAYEASSKAGAEASVATGLHQHRALPDVRHSIAALRHYREHFLLGAK